MKDLEEGMRRQFKHYLKRHPGKGDEAALRAVQNWAEDWIMRMSGKLTISSENDVKQILDKLRVKQHN